MALIILSFISLAFRLTNWLLGIVKMILLSSLLLSMARTPFRPEIQDNLLNGVRTFFLSETVVIRLIQENKTPHNQESVPAKGG
jgi:hypothetical protein